MDRLYRIVESSNSISMKIADALLRYELVRNATEQYKIDIERKDDICRRKEK